MNSPPEPAGWEKPNVIGVIPASGNVPGGSAIVPGDILKSYAGKRVEVLNTDADRRLIRAAALASAIDRYAPDSVADFATLTGACVIALGQDASGAISAVATFQERVVQAANRVPVWPLPNFHRYEEAWRGSPARKDRRVRPGLPATCRPRHCGSRRWARSCWWWTMTGKCSTSCRSC